MNNEPTPIWEAKDEAERVGALDVLYDMATGYVLSELREEYPDEYQQIVQRPRYRSMLVNKVRCAIDTLLHGLVEAYGADESDEE